MSKAIYSISPPFCIINRCKSRRGDAALVSVSFNSELRCLLLRGTSPAPLIYYSEIHFRSKATTACYSHHRSSTKAPRNTFFHGICEWILSYYDPDLLLFNETYILYITQFLHAYTVNPWYHRLLNQIQKHMPLNKMY